MCNWNLRMRGMTEKGRSNSWRNNPENVPKVIKGIKLQIQKVLSPKLNKSRENNIKNNQNKAVHIQDKKNKILTAIRKQRVIIFIGKAIWLRADLKL